MPKRGTVFWSLPFGWVQPSPRGAGDILQTQLPGEGRGNCRTSGQICIFLITRIHCETDDSAGLVLFSCLFLPLNIAKWSTINGHALNCLAQHVQH